MNIESLMLEVSDIINALAGQFNYLSATDTSKMSLLEKLEVNQRLHVLKGEIRAYRFVLGLCRDKTTRGVDFTEAIKQLHFKTGRKAKMIGKDVVISFAKRKDRGSDLVVEDSAGNSIDRSLIELLNARWRIKEGCRE